MAHPFEVRAHVEVDATPEQAWEAITNGAAVDGWFMGTNEVEPGLGGTVRTMLPGFTLESTITQWDPPHRFANTTAQAPDGGLMTFAYEIEARAGGRTVIRLVHSGFLAGDVWELEYDALKIGDPAYIQKLGQYLNYFRGRNATPIAAFGPQVDRERTWEVFKGAMGLSGSVREGDKVRFTPEGLPTIDGVVDYISPDFLGVRTSNGLYRFIHGLGDTVVLGHHIFADVDRQQTEQAWQSWLNGLFPQATPA
jgi:uncharacterized protein YndB with AHSA1/START domain